MDSLGVIAGNAFREVLHERVIYSVLIITIVVGVLMVSPMTMLQMANEAGETKMVEQLSGAVITTVLGVWSFAATVLGAILGSTAISNEVRTKTIVTVLSRPVSRSELLVGKWLGIEAFVLAYMLVGLFISCALAVYFAIQLPLIFWIAVAEMAAGVLLVSGISVALSPFAPRGVASITALLLPQIGSIAARSLSGSFAVVAGAVYFLTPAVMPTNLLDASFTKEILDPQYGLYCAVLIENVLYGAAAMVLAAVLFSHREIQLG